MKYRPLGRTGFDVSEVSFGAWAIGGSWGTVVDDDSYDALSYAIDQGVNLIDTADVYGDGRSERLVGRLLRERRGDPRIIVATKAGRRLQPHDAAGYRLENLSRFVERSLENLGVEALDLLQLHCPPTAVYARDEAFDALDTLVQRGKILHYGVSVETVSEALTALERHPRVATVQIIYNVFRTKPGEVFLPLAREKRVGVLARVPLASGLLTGKLSRATAFATDDHRAFNRHGEAFDRGETFSGVDYDTALAAVDALRPLVRDGETMAQLALRWILANPAVSCAIPGAKTRAQVDENIRASAQAPLDDATLRAIEAVYDAHIRGLVHAHW